jgi:hypothetical protein
MSNDLTGEKPSMHPGEQVTIADPDHPWFGEKGKLIEFGPYGLRCLNLSGWVVELTGGHRTYARPSQVKP